jgi:transcription elongation factor GreA
VRLERRTLRAVRVVFIVSGYFFILRRRSMREGKNLETNDLSNQSVMLTPDGKRRLEEELNDLKVVQRAKVAAEIKTALSFGDLSENAEYDEAKNAQARVEGRVRVIEEMLRKAIVIEDADRPKNAVGVGSKVRVLDMVYNEEDEYTIVGATEANPPLLVSTESPIGSALLGKKPGDEVNANTPGGVLKLKVLEIVKNT